MGKFNQTSVSNANEGMNPYTRPLEPYTLSQTYTKTIQNRSCTHQVFINKNVYFYVSYRKTHF